MDLDLGAEQRKRYLEQHWKLGLRSLATVLSIALIGVGAKVINDWNESEGYNDSSDVGAYTSIGFVSSSSTHYGYVMVSGPLS